MSGSIRAAMERCKPCAAMVATQCIYAAMTLWAKAAFSRGTSPFVFVVYRQGFATLVLAPIAIMAKRTRLEEMSLGLKGFFLVFMAALLGATVNQYLCYQALHMTSPSLTMALINTVPAITFVMAAIVGQERVDVRELSSIAKIFGTVVCVGGAFTMAFFKGPKLLNHSHGDSSSAIILHTPRSKWVMGALIQACSCCCWSIWLILQAPICKYYMDPLTLSAWTCFLSTLQSAAITFFLLPDQSAWKIGSLFELSSCIFAGVFASGVCFFLQSWCISARGALYSAMFNPLSTVITTAVAAIFLYEVLHVGSLLGAAAIIAGLYIVLWGKAVDLKRGRVPDPSKDLAKANVNEPCETLQEIELDGRRLDQVR
ncbi:unnamed protein product [Urochloa decumbens]|uniref:WAT1-related protein n=1 Tax=Urochloa decumbens TaxID=240449 RepID=A0ABC9FUI0_9POAL